MRGREGGVRAVGQVEGVWEGGANKKRWGEGGQVRTRGERGGGVGGAVAWRLQPLDSSLTELCRQRLA